MAGSIDATWLSKLTSGFGWLFGPPKHWCYNSEWGIMHAPGQCATCADHFRHTPGDAEVDESYRCAIQQRDTEFQKKYDEGYLAGRIAQKAHDKKRLNSYRSRIKVARAKVEAHEAVLDNFEIARNQLEAVLCVFEGACCELKYGNVALSDGDCDDSISDSDDDNDDGDDDNDNEDEDEDGDGEDEEEDDEDGGETGEEDSDYSDSSFEEEEEEDYDRSQVTNNQAHRQSIYVSTSTPHSTVVSSSDEIRRKMSVAHLPGQKKALADIKILVSEAQRTSYWLRTDVQNVLLSEWRRPPPFYNFLAPPATEASSWEEIDVHVDASGAGIGFYSQGRWQAWILKEGWKKANVRDIQWAEAVAVEMGIRLLLADLPSGYREKKIRLYSDNKQVVDAILAEDFKHIQVGPIVRMYHDICLSYGLHCTVGWIRGSENPADRPSRLSPLEKHRRFPHDVMIPPHLREFVLPYHFST